MTFISQRKIPNSATALGLANQRGMTLIELSVVLLILIALAGIAIPYLGSASRTAMCQATDATLHTIQEAIMGGAAGAGFYADTLGAYPADSGSSEYNLKYLFEQGNWPEYNPRIGAGWRGPYLMTGSVLDVLAGHYADSKFVHPLAVGDAVVNDAWGRPVVLQVPGQATCDALTGRTTRAGECARLVSAGAGNGQGIGEGDIDTPIDDDPLTAGENEARRRSDDRIRYLGISVPVNDDPNPACADV